jgi:hypothetical protein
MAKKTLSGNKTDRKEATAGSAALPETRTVAAAKASPESRLESRQFEVRKTEARANLIPISLEEEIRSRAYELYEQSGYSSGRETDNWLAAEREVLQRYHQHSA